MGDYLTELYGVGLITNSEQKAIINKNLHQK